MDRTAKKVRFANVPPRTPSPASSTVSWDSSSPGPSTPPQFPSAQCPPKIVRPPEYPSWQRRLSPPVVPHPLSYPTLVVTSPDDGPVIDPLLAAPIRSSHPPSLHWDVMDHPNAIKPGTAGSQWKRELAQDDLARCAVRGSAKGSPLLLRRMVLTFPGLPVRVEITPAEDPVWTSRPLPYLTFADVLYGLYRALRTSVEPREFDELEPTHRESLRRAFEKRLRNDPKSYEKNVQHGIRRIDYLGDRRLLVGLRQASSAEMSPTGRQGEVFVVQLAPV
ncbi:hypothetical protein DICSQDRAFT_139476 [Dichomitus squalens LYAD-421 SS1]|uniref:DUF6699 domain-containing protein n=1 Tax=Dichomitus squalens (strain LYAD-421) TaxID=732165 RepID=R7SR21_DICSQ|nr:uncharacterized protein DICSQDRAFT_139476 [Dichomitus squalens LYAD-421 SS1]EJF58393.1 hypothetical protein DICSQDRAFT_139476 [Dichomitus squalens LYAD-421 SS1]